MAPVARYLSLSVLALALTSQATLVRAQDAGEGGSVLRVPGFPPVQLPPAGPGFQSQRPSAGADAQDRPDADIYHEFGTVTPGRGARSRNRARQDFGGMVVGPGGVVKPSSKGPLTPKPKQVSPEEKQAQIRAALRPAIPLAAARRKTLDDLYTKLAAAKDESEAKSLASLINAVWMRSGSDTANLLMSRAESAVAAKNYPLAIELLDKLVDLQPKWAEAWNKRASARYLAGDLNGSMADVDHALKLEPNHFSALSGLAMILQRTGFDKRALQVYRRIQAIYPHQPDVEKMIDKLGLQVEGQGI